MDQPNLIPIVTVRVGIRKKSRRTGKNLVRKDEPGIAVVRNEVVVSVTKYSIPTPLTIRGLQTAGSHTHVKPV
jgi:hypothetical protein